MPGIQTILHPTDFSENARPAFEAACALARDYQATLLLLHVMAPSVSPLMAAPPADPSRPVESQKRHPRLPWPKAPDSPIRIEHRLAEGDPPEEILRLAGTFVCDLIVMGTHGKTGLKRLLTGSVAEAVLRRARCPVMVVKPPYPLTPGTEPR
jgi:nucleotide-binding universal stress UspA family protein